MKTRLIILLFLSQVAEATGNSGLNIELSYLYGIFIGIVLLIIGTDQGMKYIRKKSEIRRQLRHNATDSLADQHTSENPAH